MRRDAEGRQRIKVVFFGPTMGGKTTQLKQLYGDIEGLEKGKFVELADPTGRTLFFDFVPLQATSNIMIDIYTTAGQERHRQQRKVVLKGVDGILFVADSRPSAMQENIESIQELRGFLGDALVKQIPLIVTLNKRDLPDALPRKEMLDKLDLVGLPVYETIATKGLGVKRAFKSLVREILLLQVYAEPTQTV